MRRLDVESSTPRLARGRTAREGGPRDDRRPWLAGILFGVGLGGFVDGIVLHQVLQWHHMLSATDDHPTTDVAGLEANTLADGMFHVATLVVVIVASVVTVRDWRNGRPAPSWRWYSGALLLGWGAFNLVEGLVDHHLLGLHHVRDDVTDPALWDVGFLVLSAALAAAGAVLVRRHDPARARRRALSRAAS
jgi:uncharacterized membrane protein